MEGGEENHGKRPLEGAFLPAEKKQWKSPSQVQILESAYSVTPKPSAEVKEELAKMTGLDYKQVQYWFGNRRFFDRHGPRKYKPKNGDDERFLALPSSSSSECSRDGAGHLDSQWNLLNPQPLSVVAPADVQPGMLPAASPLRRMQSWGHSAPMSEGKLPWELQCKFMKVERKLGHALIAEGPILGVEFKPLPPDAFGASLEPTPKKRASLHSFAGKAAERLNSQPIKEAMFSPNSSASLAPCSSHLTVYDPHERELGLIPFGIPKYQFFPTERSLSENHHNVTNTHLGKVVASTMVPSPHSGSESLSKRASVPSSVTSQGLPMSTTHHHFHKEIDAKVPSNLTEKQSSMDPIFSSPPNLQYGADPITESRRPLTFSNREISDDSGVAVTGNIQMSSAGSTCKDKTERQCRLHVPVAFNYIEETNMTGPGIGQSTHDLDVEHGANGISTVASGVNDRDRNQVMENHNSRGDSNKLGQLKEYDHYVVRPRETSSKRRFGVTDKSEMRYFHDGGGSKGPIIAEWNEKERRAEYAVYNYRDSPSGSNETDSTHSAEYDYKTAAENLADSVQSKLDIVAVDREDKNPYLNQNG